jgi:DNA-binding sugar fermentation-stimulating protein
MECLFVPICLVCVRSSWQRPVHLVSKAFHRFRLCDGGRLKGVIHHGEQFIARSTRGDVKTTMVLSISATFETDVAKMMSHRKKTIATRAAKTTAAQHYNVARENRSGDPLRFPRLNFT